MLWPPFLFVHVLRLLIIRVSGANINEVELLSRIPEEFSHSGSGSTALFYFIFWKSQGLRWDAFFGPEL